MNNHHILSCDRGTHIKGGLVVLAGVTLAFVTLSSFVRDKYVADTKVTPRAPMILRPSLPHLHNAPVQEIPSVPRQLEPYKPNWGITRFAGLLVAKS